MPILASIDWQPNAAFAFTRQQIAAFAVHWHNPTDLLVAGNPTVVRENDFGGYQAVVEFEDWVWQYDNRSVPLERLFKNLYAIPPGGGAPVSLGAIQVRWQLIDAFNAQIIAVDLAPGVIGDYWIQRFPAPNRPYWMQLHPTIPPTPFVTPG